MPDIEIILVKDTNIRGEIIPAGTALVSGTLPKGFGLPDINKAMKRGDVAAMTVGVKKPDTPSTTVKKKAVKKASAKKK